jgi:hypothetical protein
MIPKTLKQPLPRVEVLSDPLLNLTRRYKMWLSHNARKPVGYSCSGYCTPLGNYLSTLFGMRVYVTGQGVLMHREGKLLKCFKLDPVLINLHIRVSVTRPVGYLYTGAEVLHLLK